MFVGHKKQLKSLEDSLDKNKLSQAYIFSGPESVGKFLLAKMFGVSLINGESKIIDNFDNSQAKQDIDMEILSPQVIEKKGIIKVKDIDVDGIREAQKKLAMFPSIGKRRVLIINDAHRLTISSQNALLKSLEEPNSSSIIILVTHKEGRILKTIKSRCQRLNFNLVSFDEIKHGFKDEINTETLERVTIFSMGKPGEVRRILEDKNLINQRELLLKELNSIFNMGINEKFDLAQDLSKNIQQTIEKLEFWIWIIRVQSYKNIRNTELLLKNYAIIKKIEEVLNKIKNPSFNGRLILENLFLSL